MKHYALHAPYGIRAAYNDHHWPTLHVFTSASARDAWVSDDPEIKKEAISAAEARRYHDEMRDVIHGEEI